MLAQRTRVQDYKLSFTYFLTYLLIYQFIQHAQTPPFGMSFSFVRKPKCNSRSSCSGLETFCEFSAVTLQVSWLRAHRLQHLNEWLCQQTVQQTEKRCCVWTVIVYSKINYYCNVILCILHCW